MERTCALRASETGTTYTNAKWASYVLTYFEGTAAEWATLTWPEAGSQNILWEEIRAEFVARFVPHDAVETIYAEFEKMSFKEGQSVRDFNKESNNVRIRLRLALKEPGPQLLAHPSADSFDPDISRQNKEITAL